MQTVYCILRFSNIKYILYWFESPYKNLIKLKNIRDLKNKLTDGPDLRCGLSHEAGKI